MRKIKLVSKLMREFLLMFESFSLLCMFESSLHSRTVFRGMQNPRESCGAIKATELNYRGLQ